MTTECKASGHKVSNPFRGHVAGQWYEDRLEKVEREKQSSECLKDPLIWLKISSHFVFGEYLAINLLLLLLL